MSTHRPISRRKGSAHLSVLKGLGGLLVALQLWLALSSIAFAARLAPEPLSKTTEYGLARAGVSVVRLIVSYTDPTQETTGSPNNQGETISCTGLGAVVASWAAKSPAPQNTWVLTDSYLVNKDLTAAPCLGNGNTNMKVRDVQIIMSSFYHSGQVTTFSVKAKALDLAVCDKCGQGQLPILLGFNNTPDPEDLNASELLPEPYMDVAALPVPNVAGTPLLLQDLKSSQPDRVAWQSNNKQRFDTDIQQLKTYVQPVKSQDTATLEPGTPLINTDGELVSVHLNSMTDPLPPSGPLLEAAIPNFAINKQNNTVHADWNTGQAQYKQAKQVKQSKNFADAKQSFHKVVQANPRFLAASAFESFAADDEATAQHTDNTNTPSNSSPTLLGLETWQVAVLGILILLVLLAVVTVLFQRSRAQARSRSAGFTPEELAEADRQATLMAQQFQAQEAQQAFHAHSPMPGAAMVGQATPAMLQSGPIPAIPVGAVPVRAQVKEVRCPNPNCNTLVPFDAKFCPNCRLWLSPSESGLHLRVSPFQQAAPASAPPPPPPSLADQPTMIPPAPVPVPVSQGASLAEQPTIPASSLKAASIAEQPTVEIGPKGGVADNERTQPYAKRTGASRLGYVVGTRSDPGIKRKYKPNEDSLFAAQGVIQAPGPQPFALLVIADGMGGHAKGADASQLAIQTIVENVLPKLVKGGVATPEVYIHMLTEGIQSANHAVHQRNVLQHDDMGTTVTAALIVESSAYVANVGDSRTYLYRESEGGLRKVTNDHSVVASLVEAGIIKPDDIYTHPKRSHIYRSLGEKAMIEVDSFTVPLQEGDKMILCSDGLWDMVRDPHIEEVIKVPHEPAQISDSLIKAAYEGGGEDNVSVIVVQATKAKASKGARLQVLAKPDSLQMPTM